MDLPDVVREALPELARIEALAAAEPETVRIECLAEVPCTFGGEDVELPVYGLVIGPEDKDRQTLGLFGGVHGLERVGTHIVLSYLESFVGRLAWDKEARRAARRCRIAAIPLVNPGGMLCKSRCNPRGVDLMRNAPVEADGRVPPLAGGHRLGGWLPWYRGRDGLELESRTLIDFVAREMFESRASLALDVHSGYGLVDRLWYPYARTTDPIPDLHHAKALGALLDKTLPHHVYQVETQSDSYTTHGDLWDHLYDTHLAGRGESQRLFLPWTLEIGSWNWVRKNPRLLLWRDGLFNPKKPHRYARAMRDHLLLFDFLLRAVRAHKRWRADEDEGEGDASDSSMRLPRPAI